MCRCAAWRSIAIQHTARPASLDKIKIKYIEEELKEKLYFLCVVLLIYFLIFIPSFPYQIWNWLGAQVLSSHLFFHNIYASSAVCSIYTAAYVLTPLFSPPLFSSHTRQFNGKRRRKNIHEKELITIRKVGKQDTAISFIMLYYYTRWMDGWII